VDGASFRGAGAGAIGWCYRALLLPAKRHPGNWGGVDQCRAITRSCPGSWYAAATVVLGDRQPGRARLAWAWQVDRGISPMVARAVGHHYDAVRSSTASSWCSSSKVLQDPLGYASPRPANGARVGASASLEGSSTATPWASSPGRRRYRRTSFRESHRVLFRACPMLTSLRVVLEIQSAAFDLAHAAF
jgi:hypothetical protein